MTDGDAAARSGFGDQAPDAIRILHVDDDPAILDLAADLLAMESEAIEVLTARSPSSALSILESERVDCIVSDYEMPETNGLEFLEAVRERHRDLPFILFTGKGSEEIASEAISAGVTDYLQKGPGTDQYAVLANRIEGYVDRKRTAEALSESRRRLSRLIGNLPGIVYRCRNEPEWPLQFVSDGCADVTGYSPEDFLSGDVRWGLDIIHPDDREATWEAVQEAVDARESFEVTYRIRTADGEERLLRERGIGVYDDDGGIEALEGFITDVTERETIDSERRELAERLQAVIEASPEPIIALDTEDNVTVWNGAAEETYGWRREEVLGEPYPAVPDDEADRFREIQETISGGESVSGREAVRLTKSGDRLVVDLSSAPVRDGDGEVIGSMAVVKDITDRVALESELRETADRLRAIIEASPEAIVAVGSDGDVTLWNAAAGDLFGFSGTAAIGSPASILPEEVSAILEDRRAATVVDDASTGEELSFTTPGGRRLDVSISTAHLDGADGGAGGVMAVIADVTDRKDHERTVTQLHEATRDLMAAETPQRIADLVIETTTGVLGFPYTAVLLWDDEIDALRVVSDTPEARARTLSPPRIMQRGEGVCGTVYDTGEPAVIHDRYSSDREIVQEDTGVRSACILPLGDHGVYVISSDEPDVFDERDIDIANLLATNAVAALDRAARETELRQRERQLVGQNERLERFAGVLSHDLRNPLNVALARLDSMPEKDEQLRTVEDAVGRIGAIVDDVLAVTRQGRVVDDPEAVDLDHVVDEAWSTLDVAGGPHVEGLDRRLAGDPVRIRRLFENLFRNAVEHAGPGCTVRVGSTRDGVYVEDDGPGIPPAERERIFEFGRTTSETGTGLGLAIVKEIADAHGWTIEAVEGESGGARFEIGGVEWLDPA